MMTATHLHLILTHFPIVGTILGFGILAYGQFVNNDSIKKVGLVLFILMAILTIPVYLTGQKAEKTVEHLSGVYEKHIEEHEELAEKAIWLMGLLGVLSLASFYTFSKKSSLAKNMTLITLIVALATSVVFALLGNLGGQIRHSEIRSNSTTLQKQNIHQDKEVDEEQAGD